MRESPSLEYLQLFIIFYYYSIYARQMQGDFVTFPENPRFQPNKLPLGGDFFMDLRPPPPAVPSRNRRSFPPLLPFLACAAAGFGAGMLNGLLGAAGGILLVLLLPHLPSPFPRSPSPTLWEREPHPRDVLTTSLCVMLPVSAVSGCFYWLGGVRPDPSLLVSLILPAFLGGLLGAALLGKIPDRTLRRIFAILVAVSGARMLM